MSFVIGNNSGVTHISSTDNHTDQGAPGLASYSVTFPEAGAHDLFMRMCVNLDANDDSFFYANGFGLKSPATGADWDFCGNLHGVGVAMPARTMRCWRPRT